MALPFAAVVNKGNQAKETAEKSFGLFVLQIETCARAEK